MANLDVIGQLPRRGRKMPGKGKGWHGEPKRHSDAASGKRTTKGVPTRGRRRPAPKYGEAIGELKWILKDWSPDADKNVESEIRKAMAELKAANLRGAIEAIETAIEYSSDSVQVEFLDETKTDLLKEAAGI